MTLDKKLLLSIFRKECGGIIHFAASSLVAESCENPYKYYDNNLYGTMILLDAMRRPGKYIVFSSTAATYGEPNIPIVETNTTVPTNPYGNTKLCGTDDEVVLTRHMEQKYVSLRYFNAAGADPEGLIGEEHDPKTHLIPIVLQAAIGKREFVSIFGGL